MDWTRVHHLFREPREMKVVLTPFDPLAWARAPIIHGSRVVKVVLLHVWHLGHVTLPLEAQSYPHRILSYNALDFSLEAGLSEGGRVSMHLLEDAALSAGCRVT